MRVGNGPPRKHHLVELLELAGDEALDLGAAELPAYRTTAS